METVSAALRAAVPAREPKIAPSAYGAAVKYCSRGRAETRSFEGKP